MLKQIDARGVPIAWREPFDVAAAPYVDERPHGESVLEMVRSIPNLPATFLDRGVVCVNGDSVPRELWACIRPKPPRADRPIAVTLHLPLGNPGGGGGSKQIVSLVAAFALVVLTYGAASGAIGAFLTIGAIGPGTIGAAVLGGAIPIAGGFATADLLAEPIARK